MKKTLIGLIAVFLLSVPAHAAFNTSSCASMRTSFGPNPTASQKIELRSCENKALKACTKSAPKNATVLITAKSTCKFSCNAGYYLTKGGECKANGPAVSKNQKRIDELLKQIEKLTKELKKLQGK